MRTKSEIQKMMELIDDRRWPQGRIARAMLQKYLRGEKSTEYNDLLVQLKEIVVSGLPVVYGKFPEEEKAEVATRAQTVLWVMADADILEGMSRMPYDVENPFADRIEVICRKYGIEIPSISEEKNDLPS